MSTPPVRFKVEFAGTIPGRFIIYPYLAVHEPVLFLSRQRELLSNNDTIMSSSIPNVVLYGGSFYGTIDLACIS